MILEKKNVLNELLEKFANDIIPDIKKKEEEITQQTLEVFSLLTDEELKSKEFLHSIHLNIKMNVDFGHILNNLEYIASAIVTGIADENALFNSIGHAFCATLESNEDVLEEMKKTAPFSHLQIIYNKWQLKLSKEE